MNLYGENAERDYRKKNKKEIDKVLEEKFGDLVISKELKNINQDDLLVLYHFNSLYPSAQIDTNSTWFKREIARPFETYISDAVCSLFNSGRCNELNRSAFFDV